MQTEHTTYYDDIVRSLDELRSVCNKLKHENRKLRAEIEDMESRLVQQQQAQSGDVMDGISDNDRIALRNQLNTYIKRIDQLLEPS